MEQAANFVVKHYEKSILWKEDELLAWMEWAAAHGFLMVAEKEGEIIGVGMVRPVNKLPDEDWYEYDIEGDIIHIDMCVAPTWEARRTLAEGMLVLLGPKPFLALRHEGKVKLHKTEKTMKALFRRFI